MEGFLATLDHWNWWILALLLFVVELAMPGVIFLWLAIAAALTGFLVLLIPSVGWQMSFIIFAILSVIAIYIGRKVWTPGNTPSDDSKLNKRADQYIGRTFTLDTAMENGRGRLHVGDGSWLAEGPDLPAGAHVKVVAVDGSVLKVEHVQSL
ncbi:MAG: NfeD family protein [Rhodospirillaceae bacterium]